MGTIFSNCDGCNNLDALTEYENMLLCDRCLNKALEEDQDQDDWDDEDDYFNDNQF